MIISLFVGLHFDFFQEKITHQTSNYFSKRLKTKFEIDKIYISPKGDILIKDIYVEDLHKDTLLMASAISTDILSIDIQNNKLDFGTLLVDKAHFESKRYEGEEGDNLKFILDFFKKDNKANKSNNRNPILSVEKIIVNDGTFVYQNQQSEREYSSPMNYNDLYVDDIYVEIDDFIFADNHFEGHIEYVRATEKSGIKLNEFNAEAYLSGQKMSLTNLTLTTKNSNLSADTLIFEYPNYSAFNDFVDSVEIYGIINNSRLNLSDISYFTYYFEGIDKSVLFNGDFKGIIQDFQFKNFDLVLSNQSKFKGDISFQNIVNPDETKFDAEIKHGYFFRNDMEEIPIPPFTYNKRLKLPSNLKGVDYAGIYGRIKGSYTNLVGTFDLVTNIGNVEFENTSFQHTNGISRIVGKIKTSGLEIESIIDNNQVPQNIYSSLETELVFDTKNNITLKTNGIVDKMFFNGYEYKGVSLDGRLADRFFKGKLQVNDKYLMMDFNGEIDFSKKAPIMKFRSNIQSAYLNKLNFFNDQKNRILCANISIDGEGKNLDDFIGFIVVSDLDYYQEGKEFNIDYADVVVSPKDSGRIFSIGSDMLNATLEGKFEVAKLPSTFDYIVSNSLPVLYEKEVDSIDIGNQSFIYYADINNFTPIQELFLPQVFLSKNTSIAGGLNTINQTFEFKYYSDSLYLYDRIFKNITIIANEKDNQLDIFSEIDEAHIDYNLDIENLSLDVIVEDNFLRPNISWASKDSGNWARFSADGYWYTENYFEFNILPSSLYINNKEWMIKEYASIVIDSSFVSFKDMEAYNKYDERILVSGNVSEDPNELLNIYVENFDIQNINNLIEGNVDYNGRVFSNICLHDIYGNLIFESDVNIDDFYINNEEIGDIKALATWDKGKENIAITGDFIKQNIQTFSFDGSYFPNKKENSIDLVCEMNETPLTFLNSYLNDKGISDISGFATGKVKVTGDPSKPILDGKVGFDYTGLRVDYLNTYFDFTGDFIIGNDEVYSNGVIELRDMLDNVAELTAQVYHDNFSDFNYNISINIPEKGYTDGVQKKYNFFKGALSGRDTLTFKNKFFCLNTNKNMNSLFYGEAFMTGQVDISGYQGYTFIEVDAKTEKGTKFTLPLSGSEEFELEDFVVFVNKDSADDSNKYENDILDKLTLELNIEATSDAKVDIVFDEVYGDKMEGVGNGDLSMKLERGEFSMNGNYEITKGDYLFTLSLLRFENIVNKRFRVESGSSITWYGDPYNPDINLKTYYPTKASTYELVSEVYSENSNQYKKRTDVNVKMNLTQKLLTPEIDFGIEIPRADERVRSALTSVVSNEQELNRQVFSLLLLNSFLPTRNNSEIEANNNIVGSTASELLSNQLSNWLSKISDDVNIGLNYRAGDVNADDELAIALSTEILNDRLVISGNFGGASNTNQTVRTNAFIGDVNVEYKLNEDGTFRVRAFARTNDFDVINNQDGTGTTQGVGIFYKKEFDKIKIPFF